MSSYVIYLATQAFSNLNIGILSTFLWDLQSINRIPTNYTRAEVRNKEFNMMGNHLAVSVPVSMPMLPDTASDIVQHSCILLWSTVNA